MTINTVKVWGIAVTLVALGAYFAFDRYTRWGLAMQATAADEEATLSVGVPVRRVHAGTWALAGALATLGGLFLAGFPGAPQPALGDAALRAFPAIVLGGLTSPARRGGRRRADRHRRGADLGLRAGLARAPTSTRSRRTSR